MKLYLFKSLFMYTQRNEEEQYQQQTMRFEKRA